MLRYSCLWVLSPLSSKSRLPAIKVKYLLLAWLGILITSWVLYMQYASYSELCRGHVCQMVIVSVLSKISDTFFFKKTHKEGLERNYFSGNFVY